MAKRRFSATLLASFMGCPLQAKFQLIDKRPRTPNAKATFGNVIHHCLDEYTWSGDVDAAKEMFADLWLNPDKLGLELGVMPRMTTFGGLMEKGLDILQWHHDHLQWEDRTVIATEHRFLVPFGEYEFKGFVDLLELRVNGKGKTLLRVIDHKCLALSAPVLMADGSTAAASDLEVGDLVVGEVDGVLVPTRVEQLFDNGQVECLRVSTASGRSIDVTPEHPFLTLDGWTKAADLEVCRSARAQDGSWARIGLGWDGVGAETVDVSEAWFLGALIGDGGMTTNSLCFTNIDPMIVTAFQVRAQKLGFEVSADHPATYRVVNREGRKSVRAYRDRHHLVGSARTKTVPPEVVTSGPNAWVGFLGGYLDTDGSVRIKPSPVISWHSVNRALLAECQQLLANLGVSARIETTKANTVEGITYRLTIADGYGVWRAARLLAPWVFGPKADRLYEILDLGEQERPDRYGWEAVVKVERLPIQPTVGVQVRCGTHVTGGLVTHNTNSRKPTMTELALNVQFCADEETEILTKRGWLRYGDVIVGEDVLTLDAKGDMAEWQPAQAINVFSTEDQTLLSMEGRGHSSLTTLNHRWAVERTVHSGSGHRRERRFTTTTGLTPDDRIVCAATVVNLPVESKWEDAFVELVGWFWTEGHWKEQAAALAQSETVNLAGTQRIRDCLTTLYGPPVASLRCGHAQVRAPAWREKVGPDCVRFYLNKPAATELRMAVQDDKALRADFLSSLTGHQLHLLIDTSVEADGHERNGARVITQRSKNRLDSFQMACSLAGVRTSLTRYEVGGQGRYAGREQWRLALLERRRHFVPAGRARGFSKTEVSHTGHVWCPTTANGTWLARRHGFVYFTGNTVYTWATLCPEFWLGTTAVDAEGNPVLDAEGNPDVYPGIADGERWYDELADVERRAIWSHLWTGTELDAGGRKQFDFDRLYRVCIEIDRAIEADVFVPDISGETCNFCSYHEPCGVSVPSPAEREADEHAWV